MVVTTVAAAAAPFTVETSEPTVQKTAGKIKIFNSVTDLIGRTPMCFLTKVNKVRLIEVALLLKVVSLTCAHSAAPQFYINIEGRRYCTFWLVDRLLVGTSQLTVSKS